MILTTAILALAFAQDPPGTADVPTTGRSAEQAQVDVCLYTPVESRDPSCEPLLLQEARLVPDDAFAGADPSSLGWANLACAPGRLAASQTRAECRTDQRDRFRRAARARQALGTGTAGGLMAEGASYTVGPATSDDSEDALALAGQSRQVGQNCERRVTTNRDQDSGDSASSYTLVCSYGSDDPQRREDARRQLENVLSAD